MVIYCYVTGFLRTGMVMHRRPPPPPGSPDPSMVMSKSLRKVLHLADEPDLTAFGVNMNR